MTESLLRGVIGLDLQRFAFDLELHDAASQFVDLHRHRIVLDAESRGGLIEQVDRLVRKKPIRDVPMAQGGRGDQRAVLDPHAMVRFVA